MAKQLPRTVAYQQPFLTLGKSVPVAFACTRTSYSVRKRANTPGPAFTSANKMYLFTTYNAFPRLIFLLLLTVRTPRAEYYVLCLFGGVCAAASKF